MKNNTRIIIVFIFFAISCNHRHNNDNLIDSNDSTAYTANNLKDTSYLVDFFKVQKYLDTIRIHYGKNNWLENYDFSSFVPDSIEKRKFSPIFGKEIKMYDSPTDSSGVVRTFSFGDTVYVPLFLNGSISRILSYRARLCDICYDTYDFCIAKNGQFGFVHSDNFVGYTKKIPDSNLKIIGNYINTALINPDYSTIKVLNSATVNCSENGKLLVFAREQESALNPSIYIYEISENKEKYIGRGYTPIFINNHIYYSFMPDGERTNERILRYNISTGKKNVHCEIPDSLTICQYGQDGGGVGTFWVKQENGEVFLHLLLSSKDFEIETSAESYILKLNGELIKQ